MSGQSNPKQKTRVERDSMGEINVPSDALYAAQTQRAVENFPISGIRESSTLINAYVLLKKAAATTNKTLGFLDEDKLRGNFLADNFTKDALTHHWSPSLKDYTYNISVVGRSRG